MRIARRKSMKSRKMKVKESIRAKTIMKKTVITGMVLALGLMAFTACGGSDDDKAADAEAASGKVVIAGSTSVQPLSEMLGEEFMAANEGVTIEVQGGGSGQGIKSIEEKIADFGSLSREVKDEEKASITEEHVIAKDGIAVIVNTETGVENITIEQLKDIYTGKIKNWKELGGEDKAITVVSREEGSGTRGAFTEITGVLEKDENGEEIDNTVSSALVQGSTGAVTQTVGNTPDSIGYISLGSLNDTVKALKVEKVDATTDNVLNESYKLQRPFLYVSGAEVSETAQKFLDFVMSEEGQAIVTEAGFIPVK